LFIFYEQHVHVLILTDEGRLSTRLLSCNNLGSRYFR